MDELCQNTRLLIRLRWAAGLGILLGTGFARWVLDVHLQAVPLLIIGLTVLSYNFLLRWICSCESKTIHVSRRVAWGQIVLDWVAMTALVHFTGGITSPTLIYFVIHAAFSGTVLLPWRARILAVLAVVIVGVLAWLEHADWLPHVVIPELRLGPDLHTNTTYILAVLFFFGTTVITLSELVANKAQSLRQREQRISELYEARSTFVRVATHELRAPLAAGLSLVHNVEQGYAGELNEQQAALLKRVESRLEGLRMLIDDLLTLAATREASIAHAPLEQVNARDILQKMIEREIPIAEQKRIVLDTRLDEHPGLVMAGDVGLAIIFGNVLNNAIKYTPAGGKVTLHYDVAPAARVLTVTVIDTGIGIPADDLPRIFSEFFRAKNAKQAQINGSGIGLAAVHTLIERYQGAIDLQSKEGKGTTVTVTLPLADPEND